MCEARKLTCAHQSDCTWVTSRGCGPFWGGGDGGRLGVASFENPTSEGKGLALSKDAWMCSPPECSELLAMFDNVLSVSLWLRFMTAWYAAVWPNRFVLP